MESFRLDLREWNKMVSLLKYIKVLFKNAWVCENNTLNKEGAQIIRRFVRGMDNKYEWDDFESITELNPNVRLALQLCWYFANYYPIDKLCEKKQNPDNLSSKALVYYLKVANALENDCFNALDHEAVIGSLKMNVLPDNVRKLLDVDCQDDTLK